MASGPLSGALQHVHRTAAPPDGGPGDAELLTRFVAARDEAAFASLVRRHGPMVLGVCRRLLRHPQDAEDAFQAAFLVLALKAGSLARPERLANWLYGTAYRAALEARAARRRLKETQVSAMPEPEAPAPAEAGDELRSALDEELSRLPERYREAVVLCELEGVTLREAARRLGVPEGTLSGRLTTARRRLSARLARRGLAPVALAAILSPGAAPAGVPPALAAATVQAATAVAAGSAVAAVAPAAVAAITGGMMKTMLLTKLRWAALALLALATLVAGPGTAAPRTEASVGMNTTARVAIAKAPVPAGKKKPAPKTDADWGKPDGGVSIRARATKKQWRASEKPEVQVDLSLGDEEMAVANLPDCEVEVDGVWYVSTRGKLVAGYRALQAGAVEKRHTAVWLEGGRWVMKSDRKKRLALAPGQHTVRVACPVGKYRPVSNAVEITISAPKE